MSEMRRQSCPDQVVVASPSSVRQLDNGKAHALRIRPELWIVKHRLSTPGLSEGSWRLLLADLDFERQQLAHSSKELQELEKKPRRPGPRYQ